MKTILSIVLLLLFSNLIAQNNLTKFFADVNQFLKLNVENGLVDYEGIKKNSSQLNALVNSIEKTDDYKTLPVDQQIAFLINAYNILVIKNVVNHYPIDSPLSVKGFFDNIEFNVGGELLTLNEIEHERLFKIKKDHRYHYALVCAAVACPYIEDFAYTPDEIELQLSKRERIILRDRRFVSVDHQRKTIILNQIFEWYEKDFLGNADNLIDYLNNNLDKRITSEYSITFKQYNWKLNKKSTGIVNTKGKNLQSYTPSSLLNKGEYEIKVFNNIYTQTSFFDNNGDKIEQNQRNTFLTSSAYILYGINSSINLGAEVWLRSVLNDGTSSSPFSVLKFGNKNNSRSAITRIGPKIKFDPSSKGIFKYLSIQSSFLFPLGNDLNGSEDNNIYIDDDSYIFLNQFLFDKKLNEDFSFFAEIDTWFRIDKDLNGSGNSFQLPLKAFINYYPNSLFTLYSTLEYAPSWSATGQHKTSTGYYSQAGLGAKYQLFKNIEIETLFTKFFIGNNAGAGYTMNFGFRILGY